MRHFGSILAVLLAMSTVGQAQVPVTRTATFENFAPGTPFFPSFTDPLSGITFSNSTAPFNQFGIDYSATAFGGGNYLAGAPNGGTGTGWSPGFGFTATLPLPADNISLNVTYPGFGDTSKIKLEGFNAAGVMVAEQTGPAIAPDPFTLEITSNHYDITTFKMNVGRGVDTGYDNISYTAMPEPGALVGSMILIWLGYFPRRRKHI